ncbi:hypothetical protein F3J20_01760 [Paraburkholderia sp. Cy-641]|uniref:hypothetical protein n=1 Tax=Paraburkholderia sp. Cy-641 TaxID=2608337 RepID=UPI0014220444|nr:hypothetical protein [Paraburkholderia sp. Cy-641]NIF76131.1 hypothetical protein [Paraburkholderia sp. Cy-641]
MLDAGQQKQNPAHLAIYGVSSIKTGGGGEIHSKAANARPVWVTTDSPRAVTTKVTTIAVTPDFLRPLRVHDTPPSRLTCAVRAVNCAATLQRLPLLLGGYLKASINKYHQ